ncbi:hypothetical protein C9J12_25445 [Photobacterium frigidiphilum]|uniref:Uncharacterized protein n=1 Tax=Photobacterium frigidiphilum TaxID=264736 RepID=A0A2T3J7W1_9GAMM|nr:hypothetical protein [Photobacterium frigidiphilum]PSU44842.1 hypothetical protein C9J12_25445 [Photobacterium frigidiphilum]
MPIDRKGLALLVNANRVSLLKTYSFYISGSASELVETLTEHAVQKGYVYERRPPPGQTLREWCVKNHAPQWACRAAFDLLITNDWTPKSDTEKAISARYILLNNHSITELWVDLLGDWLIVARDAKNEH